MNVIAFDLETESLDPQHPEYALQPWRYREGKSRITHFCYGAKGAYSFVPLAEFKAVVEQTFNHKYVVGWNTTFDVSWLIAYGLNTKGAYWIDVMSLAKWVLRSQYTDPPTKKRDKGTWSLGAIAQVWLQDWDLYDEFVDIKEGVKDTEAYWERRCFLDVEATERLFYIFWGQLSIQQQKSFLIEQMAVYCAADSRIEGCTYNMAGLSDLDKRLVATKESILNSLKEFFPEGADLPTILASPTKLADHLFGGCGYKAPLKTPSGGLSTSQDALKLLIENYPNDDHLQGIQKYRNALTMKSKFIDGPTKIKSYLGNNIFRHELRLNSTYTGRCTVSSKCKDSRSKKERPIGLAFHQTPKNKAYRRLIVPPENKAFIVADVDSQEVKLMACQSKDSKLLEIYAEGLNPHALIGSKISGVPYDEIMEGKATEEYFATIYSAGKVTNLGENYRMGARTLWLNAHTSWGLTPTLEETRKWRAVWMEERKGAVRFWKAAIELAKDRGYAETLAGRRFYLHLWNRKDSWKTESSAIMVPIQGSGADMKYLAIACIRRQLPELSFWNELHDEIIWTAPKESAKELAKKVKRILDNLPFQQAWGWTPEVKFTWSTGTGNNWGDIEEIQ